MVRMVPQPLATFTQPLTLSNRAAELPPRTYIHCTEGKDGEPPPPYLAPVRGDPAWRVVDLAAGHTAHVTAPEKLSATLLDLAAA